MSNVLSSLGQQKSTSSDYEAIIKALEGRKNVVSNAAKQVNDAIDKAEDRAFKAEQLRLQQNAQIMQAYSDRGLMLRFSMMDAKNSDGSRKYTNEEINAAVKQDYQAYLAESGYNPNPSKNSIDSAIDKGIDKAKEWGSKAKAWGTEKINNMKEARAQRQEAKAQAKAQNGEITGSGTTTTENTTIDSSGNKDTQTTTTNFKFGNQDSILNKDSATNATNATNANTTPKNESFSEQTKQDTMAQFSNSQSNENYYNDTSMQQQANNMIDAQYGSNDYLPTTRW